MDNLSCNRWQPTSAWASIATPGRGGVTRGDAGLRVELFEETYALSIVARSSGREELARILADRLGAALPPAGRLAPILPRETGEEDHAKHGGGGGRHLNPGHVDLMATTEKKEAAAPSAAFGGPPPSLRGVRYGRDHHGHLVWSGPDHWLAITRDPISAALRRDLENVAAVIDQSSARALLHVSGSDVRDALAKGFAIDLHPDVFVPGCTAVTSVAHISVQIWQAEAGRYTIAVPRSFALSFWAWLAGASAAYGYEVVA